MSVLERMEQMNCMGINGLNYVHVSRFSRLSLGKDSQDPVAREVRGNRCILMSSFSILQGCGSSTQYNVLKGSLENVDKSQFEGVGGSHTLQATIGGKPTK